MTRAGRAVVAVAVVVVLACVGAVALVALVIDAGTSQPSGVAEQVLLAELGTLLDDDEGWSEPTLQPAGCIESVGMRQSFTAALVTRPDGASAIETALVDRASRAGWAIRVGSPGEVWETAAPSGLEKHVEQQDGADAVLVLRAMTVQDDRDPSQAEVRVTISSDHQCPAAPTE